MSKQTPPNHILSVYLKQAASRISVGSVDMEHGGIELSLDKLALYIGMLLDNYPFYLQLRKKLSARQIQTLLTTAGSPDIVECHDVVVPGRTHTDDEDDEVSPAVEIPSSAKNSETPSYQFKKVNDPLYVHYSLWSVFGIVNTALVDDPDLVLFVASVAALVAVSLAAKLAPERFNPKVARNMDKWVIGVSGVRDASRIMTTFALGYWALSLHASEEIIQANVAASDIILGAAADPLFWAMIGVIGLANGYLKYKAKTNPKGLSSMVKLEKGVRGAYMACSTSTMAVLLLDCMTSLLSNAMTSGYGLLLAEPVTAAVTFAVIATAAVVGAYCGVTAKPESKNTNKLTFDDCDKTLAKVRKIFMPIAMIASLLCPELIILGAVLTVAYLLYDKYRQTKNEGKVEQEQVSEHDHGSAVWGDAASKNDITEAQTAANAEDSSPVPESSKGGAPRFTVGSPSGA